MGYGYAIWVLLTEPEILNVIDNCNEKIFYPHVTIICNLSYKDAINLYKKIKEISSNFYIDINTEYNIFDYQYGLKNEHIASGFYVDIEHFIKLRDIVKDTKGCFNENPHISVTYKYDIDDLPLNVNISKQRISGKLVIADTRSNNPEKWTLLT